MRRSIILLLLLGVTELLRPLGSAGYGAEALLSLGFLILAAYTVGEIAEAMHGPKIVGYLVAGVIFGPSVLSSVSAQAIDRLTPVSDVAVALIAFLAGAELRWSEVKQRGIVFLKIMTVELLLSFVVLASLVYLLAPLVPFLRNSSNIEVVAFSLLFASIAIVHSPAVTMALLAETGARGPVARTTLGVVLLTDVFVVLLFSLVLLGVRAVVPSATGGGLSLGGVTWDIGGALLVGVLLGLGVVVYLRFLGQELFLVAILVAFLGAEVARLAHVETLLTLVTAGFVTENVSREGRGEALRHAMERSAAPVFVVFFALAGGRIVLSDMVTLFPLLVPVALVRAAAIWAGCRIGASWAGAHEVERQSVWMGLISQAGVAIGLAALVAEAYPENGPKLRTLLLSLIALNQLIGPILFRRALSRAGEVEGAHLAPNAVRP